MFFDKGHAYAARILEKDGVELRLGVGVKAIGPGHVTLSDGSTIKTRCVIWGGGLMAAPVAGASGLPQGRGGRIDVGPDFTVAGFPGVLVIGDIANIPTRTARRTPARLGRVAERFIRRRDDHRRSRAQASQAVPLPRQGHDGDDRAGCGHRPGQRRRAARQDVRARTAVTDDRTGSRAAVPARPDRRARAAASPVRERSGLPGAPAHRGRRHDDCRSCCARSSPS